MGRGKGHHSNAERLDSLNCYYWLCFDGLVGDIGLTDCEAFLSKISDFYIKSDNYNGIPARSLIQEHGEEKVRRILAKLISDGYVSIVFGDYHPNPHIRALPPEPIEEQLEKLMTDKLEDGCVYPNRKHLENVVDYRQFHDKPFECCLAFGEPQLAYKSFELSVLEIYRNDPRYLYQYNDISGLISISNEFFETDKIKDSDQILLESFGISIDDEGNIYVAVFLRYLATLSPEHQKIWASKLVECEIPLHPDYYRASIIGNWPQRLSLYQAVLMEMRTANEISTAIGREPIFKEDFRDRKRPREFGYLLRPTLKEYNEFVHLLDKMLSENLNRKFFKDEFLLS